MRATTVSPQRSSRRVARTRARKANLDLTMFKANAREASRFLKALSHEMRLLILCFLANTEKSVSEIEQLLRRRQPALSQQLAKLRAEGLVKTRRNGKNIYYSISRREVIQVIEALHEIFCQPRGKS